MKHFSKYVKNGAKYLTTKGHFTANTLAFENADGSLVLIVGNNMDKDRVMDFSDNGARFSAEIKAHSVNTIIIEK